MEQDQLKVIISGGGTGGHVYPAIAIANEIKKQLPNAAIQFVGAQGKMEMEKVPKAGYPIEGLWISGFQRRITLKNLTFPFKLLHSWWKARGIIRRFKPDVAIGVGGYASYPTLAVASWMGIPTMIQEQNSYAGMSNKMLKESVEKICVAYEEMQNFFPQEKIVYTGNPVRSDIWEMDDLRKEALVHFGLKDKKTILVFGGSLGAKTLNEGMANNVDLLIAADGVQVIWQAGKFYHADYQKTDTAKLENVCQLEFIDRMDLAYAAADIVICRAGALTISELCLVGKAAIFIPSPNVTGDHQTKNAMALIRNNAAKMLKDENGHQMIKMALDLLEDEGNSKTNLETNIRRMAKPNAAQEIVKTLRAIAKK